MEADARRGLRLLVGDHPALLPETVGTDSGGPIVPVCPQEILVSFDGGGALQGSLAPIRAVAPVFPPQLQAMGSERLEYAGAAPVYREVFRDDRRSDDLRLQDLRDSQLWAERHENVLCAQAPVFVPGSSKPINFMNKATE